MKRIVFLIIIGLLGLALFPHCAKVVSPTGGPKDTLAPKVVSSTPRMNSTNFTGNKIIVEFDEYVQVKDVQKKLIVSPPLKTRPQVGIRGKRIEIEITDTLKENTTYTVYLGDAVSDNNEGNPISSFEFAFSTGSSIDTLSLTGNIVNAISREPVEGALVMLYDSFADSLPYITLPTHIAKTNKKGDFVVNNLKYIDYKLVAINDLNSNYLYNQGKEEIAFIDSTIKKETLIDSVAKNRLLLRTFREELPNQIMTGFERTDSNLLYLSFSRKPKGGFTLTPLQDTSKKEWYIAEPDAQGDTVKIWITSESLIAQDTLKVIASYLKTDSLNRLNPQTDTLKFINFDTSTEEKTTKTKKKGKDQEAEAIKSGFDLKTSLSSGKVAIPNLPFEFTSPIPIKEVDASKIGIFNETDSIMEPSITLIADSISPRVFYFKKEWKPTKSYKMLVLPGAFRDITHKLNDTLRLKITGADPEEYGTLIIKTNNVQQGVIAELLSEKGSFISRKSAIGNQPIVFRFIEPGKYKLRFIEDLNTNGEWDSGNYLKKIQPERIFDFTEGKNKGEINIRANWENEIQFTIPKP